MFREKEWKGGKEGGREGGAKYLHYIGKRLCGKGSPPLGWTAQGWGQSKD